MCELCRAAIPRKRCLRRKPLSRGRSGIQKQAPRPSAGIWTHIALASMSPSRRIQPHGEQFVRRIHVDPCCPSVRNVVHVSNPGLHSFVCLSGMTTRATCGIEVRSIDAQLCAFDRWGTYGCRSNLFRGVRYGTTVARGGDSGGPVYNRWSGDTAAIRGMIIGRTQVHNVYAHKVRAINQHLNVYGIAP